eukprot:GHVU01231601.1.p1 GENE.GHVU01231601.1~~GHVU01231601.1.p1  ORF type:complete len:273 (-),score=20.86 GHVU01231601.1:185-1003(-)
MLKHGIFASVIFILCISGTCDGWPFAPTAGLVESASSRYSQLLGYDPDSQRPDINSESGKTPQNPTTGASGPYWLRWFHRKKYEEGKPEDNEIEKADVPTDQGKFASWFGKVLSLFGRKRAEDKRVNLPNEEGGVEKAQGLQSLSFPWRLPMGAREPLNASATAPVSIETDQYSPSLDDASINPKTGSPGEEAADPSQDDEQNYLPLVSPNPHVKCDPFAGFKECVAQCRKTYSPDYKEAAAAAANAAPSSHGSPPALRGSRLPEAPLGVYR